MDAKRSSLKEVKEALKISLAKFDTLKGFYQGNNQRC
jgi:hypothetical protein